MWDRNIPDDNAQGDGLPSPGSQVSDSLTWYSPATGISAPLGMSISFMMDYYFSGFEGAGAESDRPAGDALW